MHDVTETEQTPETMQDLAEAQNEGSVSDALQAITDERNSLQEQLLRTMAEFQNFRKRTQAEAEQQRKYASERLVTRLLPILDNFERLIAAFDSGSSVESLVTGLKAVDRQLRTSLEQENVVRIKTHLEEFNPDVHDAIATEDSEEHPEGTVVQELEAGYKIADRVIRPAKVKVTKKS